MEDKPLFDEIEYRKDREREDLAQKWFNNILNPPDDGPTKLELISQANALEIFGDHPTRIYELLKEHQLAQELLPSQAETEKAKELEIRLTFIKDKVKGTYDLAAYLTEKYNIVTVGIREKETYVYQDGVYVRGENQIIMPEIQRILNTLVTKNAKSETLNKIQDYTYKDRSIFSTAPVDYIPLANGVYNLRNNRLISHDPKYYFKYQLPVSYDATALCPSVDSFLSMVLTPIQRQTFEEWAGYCLYRNYMYKKALIMVGVGDSGKTTLLELLAGLIGNDNRCDVSLHKISSDKFSSAQMYVKHINIHDELSADDIQDTANFKIATGGGTIVGEYKFGDQFSFSNFAKLTFACNRIPDVKDMNDEAYFNRWMVIHLEKTIEKKIANYANDYLLKPQELSGFLNIAIAGLKRLLAQDGFAYRYSGIDTKLEMMKSGSSLASFVTDKLYKDSGNEITKEKFYEAYCKYCDEKNLSPETMNIVGRKIMFYAPFVGEGRIWGYFNGKQQQVEGWRNVNVYLTQEEQDKIDKADSWMEETANLIKSNPNIVKIISK